MPGDRPLETRIADHDSAGVTIRGLSLADDLIGKASYSDLLTLGTLGRLPDANQRAVLDGCLVALMEAGLNPSALVARMAVQAAPDQAQAAMAAGLLTVGDVYVGTVQGCAELLARIGAGDDPSGIAAVAVEDLHGRGARVPGLGHGRHHDDDPRAVALLRLAADNGCAGRHRAALDTLRRAAEEQLRRTLVINVTGAVAAALLDLGFPAAATRPIAVAARAGGLVGHVVEEYERPTAKALWAAARSTVPYSQPDQEVTP
ncbi:citryl-CoA lyase [Mycolicibacterium goodii]|uniref:citrate synthase (unknown stereospecificity) n=1 Tax=Mycolicibacterium goodii TaxID=134601 RepID=A0A0K0X8V0_MYCGD|nr:hypothetical protein AFA91_19940 [Mycolicibacterium goodii]